MCRTSSDVLTGTGMNAFKRLDWENMFGLLINCG